MDTRRNGKPSQALSLPRSIRYCCRVASPSHYPCCFHAGSVCACVRVSTGLTAARGAWITGPLPTSSLHPSCCHGLSSQSCRYVQIRHTHTNTHTQTHTPTVSVAKRKDAREAQCVHVWVIVYVCTRVYRSSCTSWQISSLSGTTSPWVSRSQSVLGPLRHACSWCVHALLYIFCSSGCECVC